MYFLTVGWTVSFMYYHVLLWYGEFMFCQSMRRTVGWTVHVCITFITSRLYLRTFCDIRLDTEHIKVTEGHQMNLVLTVSMHNYL